MSACNINSHKIRSSLTSSVKSTLEKSRLFTENKGKFTIDKNHKEEANTVIQSLNDTFSISVIKKLSDTEIEISIPDELVSNYIIETKEGKELLRVIGLNFDFRIDPNSLNKDEMFTALNYEGIAEMPYEKLKEFLLSVNPDFKVQELDNLSVGGLTELKKFLISVKTLSKFRVLPEEVAHVILELLPEDNSLKLEMIKNITSLPIYSMVLSEYKEIYKNQDGTVDYDKIKREAAAKLIAEYIYSISTGDNTRIEYFTKHKQTWMEKWFGKLFKWLGLNILNRTHAYMDVAEMVLTGENKQELKTAQQIENLAFTDTFFYNASQEVLYEAAFELVKTDPEKLGPIITSFTNEFSRVYNGILKDKKFEHLNEVLSKEIGLATKLNILAEIQAKFADAKVSLKQGTEANNFIVGVKEFLEAINSLGLLSDAILKVVTSKEKGESFEAAVDNLTELTAYMGVYQTFINIISSELTDSMISSGIGSETITTILSTQANFNIVNRVITNKMKDNLAVFYTGMLSDTNQSIAREYERRLEDEKAQPSPNPKIIAEIEANMKALIVTDENIIAMLAGKGKDIDGISAMSHLVNAAVLNGDMFVAGIAKFIQDKVNEYQQLAKVDIGQFYNKIDIIQKQLQEAAHVTGKFVSFEDIISDPFSKTADKTRKVVKYLSAHKGIELAVDTFRKAKMDAYEELREIDVNDTVKYEEYLNKYKLAKTTYENFLNKYMNRPFIKEYYEFQKKFEENDIFIVAIAEYQRLSYDIEAEETLLSAEMDKEGLMESIARLRRERANLLNDLTPFGDTKTPLELEKVKVLKEYFEAATKFKELDELQTQRSFMIAQNRYEQKVDFALQLIRQANLTDILDVEQRLRELLIDNRIRIATQYDLQDGDTDINLDTVKSILLDKWTINNVNIVPNDEFYLYEQGIIKEIKELQNRNELTEYEERILEAYEVRRNLLYGSRDNIGQLNPAALNEEEIEAFLSIEEEIASLKKEKPPINIDPTKMSITDKEKWDSYNSILKDPASTTKERRAAILAKNKLTKQYKATDNDKVIKDLYALMGDLSDKVATQYYWDKMEVFIPAVSEFVREMLEEKLPKEDIRRLKDFERDFVQTVDEQRIENFDFEVLNRREFVQFLKWLGDYAPELNNWFLDNHNEKSIFDPQSKRTLKLPYVRNSLYSYKSPVLKEHQKVLYNKKYNKTKVKDEYRTGYDPITKEVNLIVGEHISNRETANGFQEFLPLTPEQGEPIDSPYRNEEYYKLKNATDGQSKLRFQYLQTLKEESLKQQEKLPPRLRRWMEAPVMGLSHIESLLNIPATVREFGDTVHSAFTKNKAGDAEAALEGYDEIEDENSLREDGDTEQGIIQDKINQKQNDIIKHGIPKIGMWQRVPAERVSRDFAKSTTQLIIRAHEFQARSKAQPVVQALLQVMRSNDNMVGEYSNKNRAEIFEKIYRQMILQEVPGGAINGRFIRRVASLLTSNTALRMMADPIGGMINYTSAMINNVIEASAGQYLNLQELAIGKGLAVKLNIDLMADINKKSNLSYYTLLFNYIDLLQGEFEEDLLDRSSSMDKWASIRQILMIPRKSGELMAQSALGMGMLHRIKVKNEIDGKEYPMHEIFEKGPNDTLRLKKGFPEEYNPITGKKFFSIKSKINHINLGLHGNYAKISQSEASRWALGKLGENMKRWFMPAIQRRFGRLTPDIMLEEATEGYYTTAGKAAMNYFGALLSLDFGGARSWADFYMREPKLRANLQRFGAELGQAFILFLVFSLMLGYSGDDKNKELENNTWVHNIAILVALRAYSETTAYIIFPGFGFQEMKRNILSPWALPSDAVSNIAAIAQVGLFTTGYLLGIESFEKDVKYNKNSGFFYSQKGDYKVFKHLIKTAGYTGYTFEPIQYIKNFDNLQNRLK